jgi:uncharacterized protein YndB with AHSA1/START domain
LDRGWRGLSDSCSSSAGETLTLTWISAAEKVMNAPDDLVLDLGFTIDAPRDAVFGAWTQSGQMRRWFAPREFTVLDAEIEAREGGAWRARMRAPDGNEHTELGTVRGCEAPTHLALTHAWLNDQGKPGHETEITIDFAEEGDKTRVQFHQATFESKSSRDQHGEGWLSAFGVLAELFGGTLSNVTFGRPGVPGELLQAAKPYVELAKAQLSGTRKNEGSRGV